MAQLTDDCFAFSGPLLPVADMEKLIAERVTPVSETEDVTLAAARGRVLANDIAAPLDLPPFDNSAVDGYAVRHGDLDANAETRLKITGRLFAGGVAVPPVQAGQAVVWFVQQAGHIRPTGVVLHANGRRTVQDADHGLQGFDPRARVGHHSGHPGAGDGPARGRGID